MNHDHIPDSGVWAGHSSSRLRPKSPLNRGTRFDDSRLGFNAARRIQMLWTIFVILMVMWLLGVTTSYTLGGFIHILLLLAIASVLIRIIQGRRVV